MVTCPHLDEKYPALHELARPDQLRTIAADWRAAGLPKLADRIEAEADALEGGAK